MKGFTRSNPFNQMKLMVDTLRLLRIAADCSGTSQKGITTILGVSSDCESVHTRSHLIPEEARWMSGLLARQRAQEQGLVHIHRSIISQVSWVS